jgi:hypothetical protein
MTLSATDHILYRLCETSLVLAVYILFIRSDRELKKRILKGGLNYIEI